jgi:hypothetical protein
MNKSRKHRKTALWVLAAFLCLSPVFLSAQGEVLLSASVDKATITIGDLIVYTVTVDRDPVVEVKLPSLASNLGGFEIRDYIVHDPKKEKGRMIDRVDYTISTFETGEFEIPPIEIRYTIPPGTDEKILKTESIKILVESVKPSEEGDIREIRSPWDIDFDWTPVYIYSAIGLGVLLLALFIFILIRKKRRGEAILPKKTEPARPPHEVAYEELQRLDGSDLLEKGKFKKYYSLISEIIRRYVEGRYYITAMELTTTELMEQLGPATYGEGHLPLFEKFLQSCDMVKFAKYKPSDEENKNVMQLAVRIVDNTRWGTSEASEHLEEEAPEEKAPETEKMSQEMQKKKEAEE